MADEGRLRREMRMVIRKARERLKMSQADFAQALSEVLGHRVSASQVSDWERGRFPPSGEVLLAAAEVAGGSLDALREGAGALGERIDELEQHVAELHGRLEERATSARLDEELAELRRSQGIMQAQILELQEVTGVAGRSAEDGVRTAKAQ